MKRVLLLAYALAAFSVPAEVAAQDKYSKFVGEWVASVLIVRACSGMTTYDQKGAAEIARSQDGLRRQKVLRLLNYSKTALLEQQGGAALVARSVDPSNTQGLCKFGRTVAGKDDSIGRFLRIK